MRLSRGAAQRGLDGVDGEPGRPVAQHLAEQQRGEQVALEAHTIGHDRDEFGLGLDPLGQVERWIYPEDMAAWDSIFQPM